MVYYQKGSIQIITKYSKQIKYLLINYLGLFRDKHTGQITFKLKTTQPDGRDMCKFEVWECQNLETGMKDIRKFPVYEHSETIPDQLEQDRKDVINDSDEVSALLDSYECWEHYVSTSPPEPKRNGRNFHLKLINDRHSQQLARLRELDSMSLPKDYQTGVRLKLIQKETPNHQAWRDFNLWKKEFPQFFTKLQNYVYKNDTDVTGNDSSNILQS